jgi:hypothetical protein
MIPNRRGDALAAGGLVFVALIVVAIIVLPTLPSANSSPEEVSRFMDAHGEALMRGHYITAFAVIGLLLMVGSLCAALRTDPGSLTSTIVLGAAVQSALTIGFSAAVTATDQSSRLGGPIQTAVLLASLNIYAMRHAGTAVLLAGAGISMMRGARFPRWLGVLGLVFAPIAALDAAFGAGVATGPFIPFAPLEAAATAGFLVWTAATSVLLLRGGQVRLNAGG